MKLLFIIRTKFFSSILPIDTLSCSSLIHTAAKYFTLTVSVSKEES
jgi:hypothetical protein